MTKIAFFVPKARRASAENLAAFIRLAKSQLSAFSEGGQWDDDRWQESSVVVVFATKTMPLTSHSYSPMAEPFKQFAKAYVRYRYSHKPAQTMQRTIQALRCIEAALVGPHGEADLSNLSGATMDVAATKCREYYVSDDLRCNTGRSLEEIVAFLRHNQLVSGLSDWKSPFKKPTILTEDLGEKGQAHRHSKLPSNEAMLALADLFATADDIESKYFTSVLVLLMATPSRISEVLALATDCIQWEQDDRGELQMYLRWRAAKGMGATKKWIVPAMRDVVEEAVRRLVEIGQPARIAARFAYEQPGVFMAPDGERAHDQGNSERPLSIEEFCSAMALARPKNAANADSSAWSALGNARWFRRLVENGKITYRGLADYVLESCRGMYWPFIDAAKTVHSWDALCLCRENDWHQDFAVKHFSWRVPRTTEVNGRFSPDRGMSLFGKRNYSYADGSPIKLTTHQPRHWLSTMSERAGMDDYTLAQWAGRARVTDNRSYDHRTPQERLSEARQLLIAGAPSLLDRIKDRQPVSYQELGVDRLGTAKATLYGMCVHDYAMAPCQKQRECMTCKEHVCIKGDHVSLERIRLLEAQTEALLLKAQQAHRDGDFGADRWVDNHKWKLANVKAMRVALERQEVAEGSVLRIPDGHDPSPVQRALMNLKVESVYSPEAIGSGSVHFSLTQA